MSYTPSKSQLEELRRSLVKKCSSMLLSKTGYDKAAYERAIEDLKKVDKILLAYNS